MNFLFAWRYFKAKKSANAINIIAWVTVSVIAFATACQILVLSVFNGFEGLVKSLYASFYTDINIIPAKGKTFILTADQIRSIKQQPGVYAISLVAQDKALIKNDSVQTVVYLKGVDDNYVNVSGVASKIVDGTYNTGTLDNPQLVIGAGIQNAAGIYVEGALKSPALTIILPKRGDYAINDPISSLSEGTIMANGVFEIQEDFDNKYAITNINFVKQQMGFGRDEYSAVEIKLNNPENITAEQKTLSNLMGPAYLVQTKYEQNTSLYDTLRLEKWAIYAILTLILIVAAFNMVSALTMLVLEKQKDISVLQSMGANKDLIQKIFLTEGLLLGAIGAVTGILLAIIICVLQLKFKLIKLQGGSFLIDYFPVQLKVADFILVSVTVSIISFIASWFPARKAARQSFELRGS
ncbi:MAG TPA: FtsX-like permease family protein [Ferruginibacter sp.]|nr:FtsX-like permease family protein [Ferruginibacter sp.]